MKLNWDKWLYGMAGAIVGGGSSAVVGGIVSAFAFKVDVATWIGAFKIISIMLANFAVAGFFSMFFYLKQSPVPPPVEENNLGRADDAKGLPGPGNDAQTGK